MHDTVNLFDDCQQHIFSTAGCWEELPPKWDLEGSSPPVRVMSSDNAFCEYSAYAQKEYCRETTLLSLGVKLSSVVYIAHHGNENWIFRSLSSPGYLNQPHVTLLWPVSLHHWKLNELINWSRGILDCWIASKLFIAVMNSFSDDRRNDAY